MIGRFINWWSAVKEERRASRWEHGCATAVIERMFPGSRGLVMEPAEKESKMRSCKEWANGYGYGQQMPLAFSLPTSIQPKQD